MEVLNGRFMLGLRRKPGHSLVGHPQLQRICLHQHLGADVELQAVHQQGLSHVFLHHAVAHGEHIHSVSATLHEPDAFALAAFGWLADLEAFALRCVLHQPLDVVWDYLCLGLKFLLLFEIALHFVEYFSQSLFLALLLHIHELVEATGILDLLAQIVARTLR